MLSVPNCVYWKKDTVPLYQGKVLKKGKKKMAADKEKRAVLLVSFGTSVPKTRARTIDRIEGELAQAFPQYRIYRAWTSRILIDKLFRRNKIRIPTVEEAVLQMQKDGITQVIVQPAHLVDGIENERMKEDVLRYGTAFEKISFGEPLLASTEDQKRVIEAIMKEFAFLEENDALVFMGHGTAHSANSVYAALDDMLKDLGYSHVFLGTVEACPSLDTLLGRVRAICPRKVFLAPFMVVAGDHAIHDMSGEDEDSWRSRFEAEHLTVECVMRGIGEYPGVRKIYVEHARTAEAALN